MSVKVQIPNPFHRLTHGEYEMEANPGTLAALLDDLNMKFPGIRDRISEGGRIRKYVNIYVNGKDIRLLKAEATEINDGDNVSIVSAIDEG
jgi:molybdopterin synthase sulfur carrier subunit